MAFMGGTKEACCNECYASVRFFKLYQSYRPEHVWTDNERMMATLLCIDCELGIRKTEWSKWNEDEKEVAGADYATMPKVKIDQKGRAKQNWKCKSEHIINARLSIKALRDDVAEQGEDVQPLVCHMEFLQIVENESRETDKDEIMFSAQSSSRADLGAVDAGSGCSGGPNDEENEGRETAKRPRADLPKGRSDMIVKDAQGDKRLTATVVRIAILIKAKALAKGVLGLLKGSPDTLNAFAAAGKAMMAQSDLYDKLQTMHTKWHETQDPDDFKALEYLEYKYERIQEHTTA